jgi:dTDP-4-amino-4,6-dideoxygalactose transaminase
MAVNDISAAARQQFEPIRFNRPYMTGRELGFIQEAICDGHISGDGPFTKRCQALLEDLLGCKKVLLTTSCTDALEMSALLLDIKPGDEVIVPSFTFVSTVNSFVLRGAVPRFIDIRPDTLNLDESRFERLIGPHTKAVIPVHYAGVACEMDAILKIASNHGVAVIEDNAHGLFGRFHDQLLGTFGSLATLSFHETKNISCGEGGALLINDPTYIERAEILREKGTNRSRFFRGQVDKYSWVDIGSSFLPSDLLAAFLWPQLLEREAIQALRCRVWTLYHEGLREWANEEGVRLPVIPVHCEQPYHMFYLIMPTPNDRDRLIAHLRDRGIHAVFHYVPLHLSEMGRRTGPADCAVTESVSSRLLRLPFYNSLTECDQLRVIDAVRQFHCPAE